MSTICKRRHISRCRKRCENIHVIYIYIHINIFIDQVWCSYVVWHKASRVMRVAFSYVLIWLPVCNGVSVQIHSHSMLQLHPLFSLLECCEIGRLSCMVHASINLVCYVTSWMSCQIRMVYASMNTVHHVSNGMNFEFRMVHRSINFSRDELGL